MLIVKEETQIVSEIIPSVLFSGSFPEERHKPKLQ